MTAPSSRVFGLAVLALLLAACGRDSNRTAAYCQQLQRTLAHGSEVSSVDCDESIGGTNSQYRSGIRLTITLLPGAGGQGKAVARQTAAAIWQAHRPELAALITAVDGGPVQSQSAQPEPVPRPSSTSSAPQLHPTVSYLLPLFQTTGNFASLDDRDLYNELQAEYGPQKKLPA